MRLDRLEIINEEFYAERVTPAQLDLLLADGWRHFGRNFFRYNFGIYEGEIRRVTPLRIRLDDFSHSKSQRRNLRRNSDLDCSIEPMEITPEIHELFHRHKLRFKSGVPDSIYDFVANGREDSPTSVFIVTVRGADRLLAVSFFDVGEGAISSIYGIFDPDESPRGLGIFTLLKEIEYAREAGMTFCYPGYAYEGESFYDYKKRFAALECFDWNGDWVRFERA